LRAQDKSSWVRKHIYLRQPRSIFPRPLVAKRVIFFHLVVIAPRAPRSIADKIRSETDELAGPIDNDREVIRLRRIAAFASGHPPRCFGDQVGDGDVQRTDANEVDDFVRQ
jgi:hypothetical protein